LIAKLLGTEDDGVVRLAKSVRVEPCVAKPRLGSLAILDPKRLQLFHIQNMRKAWRCQPMTVSGFTIISRSPVLPNFGQPDPADDWPSSVWDASSPSRSDSDLGAPCPNHPTEVANSHSQARTPTAPISRSPPRATTSHQIRHTKSNIGARYGLQMTFLSFETDEERPIVLAGDVQDLAQLADIARD
jgi:hypothetical protein